MALVVRKQAPVETSDRWEDYDKTTRIQLRSIDNPQYQVAIGRARRIVEGFDQKAGSEPVAMDGERTWFDLQSAALAHYVIAGWEGVPDEDGNPVEYSPEAAEGLLKADVSFFMWVLNKATTIAAERLKSVEESVGKPRRGGNGKGSGAAPRKSAA